MRTIQVTEVLGYSAHLHGKTGLDASSMGLW